MELIPAPVVTVTSTVCEPGGAMASMVLSLTTVNDSAPTPPKSTALAAWPWTKPNPVIVTDCPPVVGPKLAELGFSTPATAGAGAPTRRSQRRGRQRGRRRSPPRTTAAASSGWLAGR